MRWSGEPKGFNGTGPQEWKHRLETCVEGCNERLLAFMNWAETQEGIIDPEANIQAEYLVYNSDLYYILTENTEGESFDLVRSDPNHNGGKTWRKLCRRFSGKTRGS